MRLAERELRAVAVARGQGLQARLTRAALVARAGELAGTLRDAARAVDFIFFIIITIVDSVIWFSNPFLLFLIPLVLCACVILREKAGSPQDGRVRL